jgi:ketosteroid isomerase-like protein
MRSALLVLLVACGGSRNIVEQPFRADWWSEGRFHSAQLDSYWQTVAGVRWGVAINDAGFEVNHVDGAPRTLVSLENGNNPMSFVQQRADAERIDYTGPAGSVHVTRQPNGWRGEFVQPGQAPVVFDVVRTDLPRVPAIEQADLDFAADTAKDGADGWARHFDDRGAMWQGGHRIEGDAIKNTMTKTLAAGSLTWRPVTSGARGDLGFSLGTAEFTEPGGKPEHITYCTIWKHEADGSWKVLFDIGRPAT